MRLLGLALGFITFAGCSSEDSSQSSSLSMLEQQCIFASDASDFTQSGVREIESRNILREVSEGYLSVLDLKQKDLQLLFSMDTARGFSQRSLGDIISPFEPVRISRLVDKSDIDPLRNPDAGFWLVSTFAGGNEYGVIFDSTGTTVLAEVRDSEIVCNENAPIAPTEGSEFSQEGEQCGGNSPTPKRCAPGLVCEVQAGGPLGPTDAPGMCTVP